MTAVEPKEYYRNAQDGQRGFIVVVDGEKRIQYDRPNQEIIVPYVEHLWVPDHEDRPLNRMQGAIVAFEADKALCKAMGLQLLAKREWLNMPEPMRIRWMDGTVELTGDRRLLYRHVRKALEGLVRSR